ncbi:MAG: heme-binding protein [Cyclobacteriaceae bacterium]
MGVTSESLPKPQASQIKFQEVPPKTMAALSFGGWADDKSIEEQKQKLITVLREEGISHTDKFYFFGYNAPYEVLNRRNEVIVELEEEQ